MKLATYLTLAAEVVSILMGTTLLPDGWRIAGAFLAACGTGLFWAAVWTMKDSWRAGVPASDRTELVTRGIFQLSRNPAFAGFDLVYLGLALMFFNPVLAVMSAAACLMLHLQIVCHEEPFLKATFGEAYLNYSRRVNRYFGRRAGN